MSREIIIIDCRECGLPLDRGIHNQKIYHQKCLDSRRKRQYRKYRQKMRATQ